MFGATVLLSTVTRSREGDTSLAADGPEVESLVVECLRCGTSRVARRDVFKHLESPECQHCGYLGWQPLLEVTEGDRRRRPRTRKLFELRRTTAA